MTKYDKIWQNMTESVKTNRERKKSDQIRPNLSKYDQIRPNMTKYDQIWLNQFENSSKFGLIWSDLIRFERIKEKGHKSLKRKGK